MDIGRFPAAKRVGGGKVDELVHVTLESLRSLSLDNGDVGKNSDSGEYRHHRNGDNHLDEGEASVTLHDGSWWKGIREG